MKAKRFDLVSIKLVREATLTYQPRRIQCPQDAADIAKDFLEDADREQLLVLCLNTKNEPTSITVASIGTINSCPVHCREIFKTAVLSSAASVIIFHNHPSGDVNPSREDIEITKRLSDAGKVLGIPVMDHVIIGGEGKFASLKEKGIIDV